MADIIPPVQIGTTRVEHFTVSDTESAFSFLRASINRHRGETGVHSGRYVRLYVNGQLMMSDTHMERNTNYEVIRNAKGDVLIAGLGIGLIILPIARKPEVASVTVIEKHADVIRAVQPPLLEVLGPDASKLKVIHADIFEWKPEKGTRFDTAYFDIWADICTDNLEQIARLHQRYKAYLKGQRWMGSWQREHLKAIKRRGL
jgi:spermidine synthase